MYAIVKTGGKQVKVSQGDKLRVEHLEGTAGDKISLNQVLLVGDKDKVTVGTPLIDGATVDAEIVDQIRDNKVVVFKKKRRQGYRRTKGHRQQLTVLEVTSINASGGKKPAAGNASKSTTAKSTAAKPTAAKATAEKKAPAKKTAAKKPAAKKTAAKKPAAKKTTAKK